MSKSPAFNRKYLAGNYRYQEFKNKKLKAVSSAVKTPECASNSLLKLEDKQQGLLIAPRDLSFS